MKILFILMLTSLLATGCAKKQIHQGNVLDADNIWIIQEGDTRFAIEQEMGTPAIRDAEHPNRVLYIEYVDNRETDERYTRGVEITYDTEWRAEQIRRFGFE